MKAEKPKFDTNLYEWKVNEFIPISRLIEKVRQYQASGQRVVTTNGCFDLLHQGHVSFLQEIRAQGDILIVGLNSDESVRGLKGPTRPIYSESARALILCALRMVDHVVIFNDLLANDFLAAIQPDIHCKGADYATKNLPETEIVQRYGGKVYIAKTPGKQSTTQIIEQIYAHRVVLKPDKGV